MTWASNLGIRHKFGGPKRAWYIRRQFTYSVGRNIINRLVTEYLCPVSGKWSIDFNGTYPRSKGEATRTAFLYASTHLDDVGEITVVCRRVPMSMRIRVSK